MRNNTLIVGIQSHTLSPEETAYLQHPTVRGVILFTRNYTSSQQLKQLTAHIHSLRPKNPLYIFTDQEGGRVQRFKHDFTTIPPMRQLQQNHIDITDIAYLLASELKEHGVDASFTPILDIDYGHNDIIADRAFANNPKDIISQTDKFIIGLRHAQMEPTIKHFPGHGYVQHDSHLQLPIDNRSMEQLQQQDLIPFIHHIQHSQVQMIMTAHICYPNIHQDIATFSTFWLTDFLRNTLKYQGVIISDDLEMQAVSNQYKNIEEVVKKALQAGCNWLLICQQQTLIQQAISYLETQPPATNNYVEPMLYTKPNVDVERCNRTKQLLIDCL